MVRLMVKNSFSTATDLIVHHSVDDPRPRPADFQSAEHVCSRAVRLVRKHIFQESSMLEADIPGFFVDFQCNPVLSQFFYMEKFHGFSISSDGLLMLLSFFSLIKRCGFMWRAS
eukprot:s1890_g12.t1